MIIFSAYKTKNGVRIKIDNSYIFNQVKQETVKPIRGRLATRKERLIKGVLV